MESQPGTWKIIWAGVDGWNAEASTTNSPIAGLQPLLDEKISFSVYLDVA